MRTTLVCLTFVTAASAVQPAAGQSLQKSLEVVLAVGPKGEGHAAARGAMEIINAAAVQQLPEVLQAMNRANPLAQNWLRGAAEAIAGRAISQPDSKQDKLPADVLEAFLKDEKNAPRARRLAYELLAKVDPSAEKRLIPGMLNDSSVELRRDAVAQAFSAAEELAKTDKEGALAKYRVVLAAARDQDQIKAVAEKLKAAGDKPDLATHYGFLLQWKLLAPFDNVGDKAWDVALPPEEKLDWTAEYDGKEGKIRWADHATTHELGMVDLNAALAKHKGAICYAATEFLSDKEQEVDVRLSCVTAVKLWINGELVLANHSYHSTTGEDVDQFVRRVKLRQGKNAILLKVCQNEQTEQWAQRWQFQLRICDRVGTPIFSQDRTLPKTAAR